MNRYQWNRFISKYTSSCHSRRRQYNYFLGRNGQIKIQPQFAVTTPHHVHQRYCSCYFTTTSCCDIKRSINQQHRPAFLDLVVRNKVSTIYTSSNTHAKTVTGQQYLRTLVTTGKDEDNLSSATSCNRKIFANTKEVDTTNEMNVAVVEDVSVTAPLDTEVEQKLDSKNPELILFPWYHDNFYLGQLSKLKLYRFQKFITIRYLLWQPQWESILMTIPFYRGVRTNELTKDFEYAFIQSVAGIITNIYSLSRNVVLPETSSGDLEVNFQWEPEKESSSDQKKEETDPNSVSSDSGMRTDQLNDMISPSLRSIFESAHEHGKDRLRINLKLQPLSTDLMNVYCIPTITRDFVKKEPENLKQLRSQCMETPTIGFGSTFDRVLKPGKVETTVEVHVKVTCLESFQVYDIETGELIQGRPPSPDGSFEVTSHFVKFEGVVTSQYITGDYPKFNVNKWKIIDIDNIVARKHGSSSIFYEIFDFE